MARLESLLEKITLGNARNRKLVADYCSLELSRKAPIYRKLAEQYPFFSYLPNGQSNPIESLVKTEENLDALLKKVEELHPKRRFFGILPAQNSKNNLNQFITNVNNLVKITREAISVQRQFYVSLIKSIKDVSQTHKLTPEDAASNPDLWDEIYRVTVPERKEAENLNAFSLESIFNIFEACREIIHYTSTLPGANSTNEPPSGIPSREAQDAFRAALTSFYSKELDRIYGSKFR